MPPTLVSFAIQVSQADLVVSAALDRAGRQVYLCRVPLADSKLALPDYTAFMANLGLVKHLSQQHKIAAAATVGHSGAAVAVAKMCFGNHLGFAFADRPTPTCSAGSGSLLLALDRLDFDAQSELKHQGAILIGESIAEPVCGKWTKR